MFTYRAPYGGASPGNYSTRYVSTIELTSCGAVRSAGRNVALVETKVTIRFRGRGKLLLRPNCALIQVAARVGEKNAHRNLEIRFNGDSRRSSLVEGVTVGKTLKRATGGF
jgi:hypothetical protein